ncbi:hypothetical protein [Leptolyngbya sp. FACHB-261]|uniref:hypothetical protein n=1 Tax=Leptolyngbya sp. FACHB-261 TaxID=2692806 RepID=UPI0016853523|nr:hypothetical protein [Leptolyngbya sp. FACHB-261]MBD2102564.1 hypothetical protein [Leptolyngbya sp. FACHB-261]
MTSASIAQQNWLDLTGYQLWDLVGIDGLQVTTSLVGDLAGRIAPFQSFETTLDQQACSVLRLCEGNFRFGLQGDSTFFEQVNLADQRVWLRRCKQMTAIAMPEAEGLALLPKIAVAKLPHRLEGLQPNCAAPSRIDGISVLIWRHLYQGQAVFELQMAAKDAATIRAIC